MINSAEKGGGIRLVGIEPEKEALVTDIKTRLVDGSYLEPVSRGKPILIGEKLAGKLDVKPGSKLVVTCLDLNFQPVYYQFRVGGIFRTVSTAYDESIAFINRSDLLEITGLPPDAAHEVAIYLSSGEASGPYASELDNALPNLTAQEWHEVMPELGYLTETMDLYMYIFMLVILLALGFGIVNTMLMVVLERIKEIGMLMAVGMNKRRIFGMIMLETVFLSLTGGVIGIALGSAVSLHFANTGIDLTALYGEGLASYGYDAFVYTAITPGMVITTTLLVVLTGILASVYPARKALKLNPSEALQTA
jgi:ABC-type lipoprotein release transport system permease subunit